MGVSFILDYLTSLVRRWVLEVGMESGMMRFWVVEREKAEGGGGKAIK
jgi:hypothetical protein